MYKRDGSLISLFGKPIGLGTDEINAALITDALNKAAGYGGTPLFDRCVTVASVPHGVRQESDEYACSCGARWDVSEGEAHP